MGKPLAIDLFCGLGGWTEGLLSEGYNVVGFDVERHVYGDEKYPAQLVLQDVLTIHGKQFKDAALIVASPPCQEYSYMAMPWSKGKQKRREYLDGTRDQAKLTALFDACFRIQREASEAAGHHIPMVVENVRGAQEWVGRSRWNFGSFHLWGDVPALMPIPLSNEGPKSPIGNASGAPLWKNRPINSLSHATRTDEAKSWYSEGQKVPGFRFDGSGKSFQTESVNRTREGQKIPSGDAKRTAKGRSAALGNLDAFRKGIKQGGDWLNAASGDSISRRTSSRSTARKRAAGRDCQDTTGAITPYRVGLLALK